MNSIPQKREKNTKQSVPPRVSPGQRFGRWTVLGPSEQEPHGERKWLCRCTCGAERAVLERSLLSGGSQSCGCLRRERARQAVAMELTGRRFGALTVLGPTPKQKNGGLRWRCRCDCGNEYITAGTLLVTGRRTRCPEHRKNYAFKDISGQRFQRLTALYPAERQNGRGMIWHCRCDCGNEVDVPYNDLAYGNMKSCGCRKKEHDQQLKELLTHVDSTSIDALRSRHRPVNNTTGCRGVYKVRGKYTAKIVFQKKQYCLGTYTQIEEAEAARRQAERLLFEEAVSLYDQWKLRANADAGWASAHPIRFEVHKDETGMPRVCAQPWLELYPEGH